MLRGSSRRDFRLHHAAICFIACLAFAHVLTAYWSIQHEEVWVGLSPLQKISRAFKVLLVDAYMPRTKADNRGSCPVTDHIPKVLRHAVLHRLSASSCNYTVKRSATSVMARVGWVHP